MLKEIKNKREHYFEDSLGRIQGEYKAWHDNGVLWDHRYYVDGKIHGEAKAWYSNGVLSYHGYYVDGVIEHDFLLNPLTDIEKMLLVLKHGGLLLPRGDLC